MNTAAKMIPIPELTLTEKIKSEQEKLQLMRKRSKSADTLMTDYQATLDRLREESDQAFYTHTSQPSKTNDKAYEDAKAAVLKLTADYEEAGAVKRRLPDRLKNAERLIHSLQRQKQAAINILADQKLGKKKEVAMSKASDSIVMATALTACCSESGDLNNFMSLGNVNIHALVTKIVSTNEFRQAVDDTYKKLMHSLRIEEL